MYSIQIYFNHYILVGSHGYLFFKKIIIKLNIGNIYKFQDQLIIATVCTFALIKLFHIAYTTDTTNKRNSLDRANSNIKLGWSKAYQFGNERVPPKWIRISVYLEPSRCT